MKERLDSIVAFLKTGIWLLPETGLSRPRACFVRALKVLLLSARGFMRDQCTVRASALTLYSLLSIVPVVAVVFGIAKGFGFEKRLQAELLVEFSEYSDILMKVFRFSDSLLEKTSGGIVAGIGVALLFWTVVSVLSSIEAAFNHIWKVRKSRSIARMCSDYLSFAMVGPFIFLMAGSVTVTLAGQLEYVAQQAARWGIPPQAILFVLEIVPFPLVWGLFAFVLILMPNTKVQLKPGFIAAVAAGTVFQLTQWVYIAFQVGVSRANAIYGSLAALPLFLAWLQVSWLIVLMGSEISYALQNLDTLGFPEEAETVVPHHRRALSLLVARMVAARFAAGDAPPTPSLIALSLGAPSPLVRRILDDFSAAGLFREMKAAKGEEAPWQPARDIHGITVQAVLDALDRRGAAEPPFAATDDFRKAAESLDALGSAAEASPANRPLLEL
ncbi:MAG: YihY/virulence factor BrkB family protein [Thermodesulfobacteriota bacterium]